MKDSFAEFINRLPFYGLAVICADNPVASEVTRHLPKLFITYGIDNEADFRAYDIRQQRTETSFRVAHGSDKDYLSVKLSMPGKHNVLNALAAIAVATELGVNKDAIIRALENFAGIARRCDILGEILVDRNHVLLVDDYAHHPAEIDAIFSAVRAGWPERRMVVIFQPHRYTRTRDLFNEFCRVLSNIEVLILLKIYSAGEQAIEGIDSRALGDAIRVLGRNEALLVEDDSELYSVLPGVVKDGDVLLIIGAGSIGTLGSKLLDHYSTNVH